MRKRLRASIATALSALMAASPTLAYAQAADTGASNIRINGGGSGATAASLVLPLGKSAIIDLPADARDVLLSNPATADAVVRTSRRVYIIGRAIGQTNAFFFDASGHQIANVEIRVEPDVAPLNDILQRYSTNSTVHAEAVNGSIVLSGTVPSAAESQTVYDIASRFIGSNASNTSGPQIVNLLQVEGSEQVLVRVRIVEMSRTLVRQLGVNMNYDEIVNQLFNSDHFWNVATENGFSISGRLLGGLTASGGIAENILQPESLTYPSGNVDPGGTSTGSSGVGGYSSQPLYDPNGNYTGQQVTYGPAEAVTDRQTQASIQAFERAGLLRILAEPNLTAISGESARFLAGGEFPVPVNSDDGQISVEFKPFGVGLAVTPVVLSGGRISLKLSTEVSELTSEGAISTGDTPIRQPDGSTTVVRGITIPALQVRRAETTVEMPSGGAIVMAGLIREATRHAIEGLPGAMNLPVLGTLFRSRDFINNESELVIIVTPYLVHAANPSQLRTPSDGFMNPSEGQAMFLGRLNAVYRGDSDGPGETADRRRLHGPSGHVIP